MKNVVDQAAIRSEVEQRIHKVNVVESWTTPAGRPRTFPMYEASLTNEYLRKSRTLKSKDRADIERQIRNQVETWVEQEIKARVTEAKNDAQQQAADMTAEATAELAALEGILAATLDVDDRLDWEALADKRSFPRFSFPEAAPTPPIRPAFEAPRASLWEYVLPFLRTRRLATTERLQQEADDYFARLQAGHQQALSAWNQRREAAKQEHATKKAQFEATQQEHNQRVASFRQRFEAAEPAAIEEYLNAVFERSAYPASWSPQAAVKYQNETDTVLVDLTIPASDALPATTGFKYVKSKNEFQPSTMKPKEHAALYDSVVKQTALRTLHEVFESIYLSKAGTVVVNEWVTYIDRGTGQEQTSCILSVSAERAEFEALNLAHIDPSECLKRLKGLIAGPLADLGPVKPILELDRSDSRFRESQDVLAAYNSKTNLAEVPWEEFEHLVRELFSAMFSSDGAEVKVTQASRDGGVDAIAFDPDPIRGGKFVIQAKRYNNVVPVSAVRDLYGTMISEGATKGILVTTSYYGSDSRGFAKDKPISLIDGANLVYLLEEHGHQVRIDLKGRTARIEGR